jgi:hypothetical protein
MENLRELLLTKDLWEHVDVNSVSGLVYCMTNKVLADPIVVFEKLGLSYDGLYQAAVYYLNKFVEWKDGNIVDLSIIDTIREKLTINSVDEAKKCFYDATILYYIKSKSMLPLKN